MSEARNRSVAVLGLLTIAAYGAWQYSFGVLLDPILVDTGWRESHLAATFSGGLLMSGLGAIAAGRLLDRAGSRVPFAIGGTIGAFGFAVATTATSFPVFAAGSIVGGSVLGAFGFYHMTQTVVARVDADTPARSIAHLTVWGAFSSPIYLPLAAELVERFGWRRALQILVASAVSLFFVAALAISVPPTAAKSSAAPPPGSGALRRVWAPGPARSFTACIALIGVASSVILSYQVPVMTAAGLSLSTAATMAGFRGAMQVTGRIPLSRLVSRMGTPRTFQVAAAAIGAGSLLLVAASSIPVAFLFAVATGFGIGAYSPLQGIRTNELFDADTLGETMGVLALIFLVTGAVAPTVAGMLAEATGSRGSVPFLAAGCAFAAAAIGGGTAE